MSGETVPSPGCILRVFPQYPLSPLSRPKDSLLSAPRFLLLTCLTTTAFQKRNFWVRREPRSPAPQPGRHHCQVRRDLLLPPQTTSLAAAVPVLGRGGHLHWESCPGCKALQRRAGVGSPRRRGLGTHPSAGRFEPPQVVWPGAACFPQSPWAPRHPCGSNALGSCSHSH